MALRLMNRLPKKEKSVINNHIFHNGTRFGTMMVSFVLSFFPRDVLDEILKLIESVSEDFPSYSCCKC